MRRALIPLLAALAGAALALGLVALIDDEPDPPESVDAQDLFEGPELWAELTVEQRFELAQICRRRLAGDRTPAATERDPVSRIDVADLVAYVGSQLGAPRDEEDDGSEPSISDACALGAERLQTLAGPPRVRDRSLVLTNREWPRLSTTASDPGWAGLELRVAGQLAIPDDDSARVIVLKPGDSIAGPAVIALPEPPGGIEDNGYVLVEGRVAGTRGCPPFEPSAFADCEVLLDEPRVRELPQDRAIRLMSVERAFAPLDAERSIPGFELLDLASWYRDSLDVLITVRNVSNREATLRIEGATLGTRSNDLASGELRLSPRSELTGRALAPGAEDTRLLVFSPAPAIEAQNLLLEAQIVDDRAARHAADLTARLDPIRSQPAETLSFGGSRDVRSARSR